MKEVEQVRNRLQAIAADLDAGNYRLGSWQAVIADADKLPIRQPSCSTPIRSAF
ncbi:MAG: hypothetical protein VCA12_09135 [Pseudomonadales bacterium]